MAQYVLSWVFPHLSLRLTYVTPAAEEGMKELSEHVDSLITIPNEKLLSVLGKNATLLTAFSAANDVLLGAVQGIAELITSPGIINVDFADVRTVMSEMGMVMMITATNDMFLVWYFFE